MISPDRKLPSPVQVDFVKVDLTKSVSVKKIAASKNKTRLKKLIEDGMFNSKRGWIDAPMVYFSK